MSHKYAYSRKSLATNMRKLFHNSSHLRSERNDGKAACMARGWEGGGGSRGVVYMLTCAVCIMLITMFNPLYVQCPI